MVAGVIVLVVRRGARTALLPAAVGGGGAVLILLAAILGADYLNNRNTIPVLVIVLAIPALGFALGRLGAALGVAACVALLAATIGALIDPAHAREDWRGAARALRSTPAVVVAPPFNETPLRWYAPGLRSVPTATAREFAVVIPDPKRDPLAPGALAAPPAPGFSPAGTETRGRLLIARYRAPGPQPIPREAIDAWARARLGTKRGGAGGVLLAR